MAAKFEINDLDDGTFAFDLKAANGEVIASSQIYTSRSDAMDGIRAVRDAAPVAELPPDGDDMPPDGNRLLHMH